MAKRKIRKLNCGCPHCFVDFKELTEVRCRKCGRVSDGLRWCCLGGGKNFSARKLGGGYLPFCPVCSANKWVKGLFADLNLPSDGGKTV